MRHGNYTVRSNDLRGTPIGREIYLQCKAISINTVTHQPTFGESETDSEASGDGSRDDSEDGGDDPGDRMDVDDSCHGARRNARRGTAGPSDSGPSFYDEFVDYGGFRGYMETHVEELNTAQMEMRDVLDRRITSNTRRLKNVEDQQTETAYQLRAAQAHNMWSAHQQMIQYRMGMRPPADYVPTPYPFFPPYDPRTAANVPDYDPDRAYFTTYHEHDPFWGPGGAGGGGQ